MAYLFGGILPVPHSSGGGDAWVAVLAILAFAVAVTVAMVLANRPAKTEATTTETSLTIRKAA